LKQQYFQKEYEKVRQQCQDLRKTNKINKEIINQLLQMGSQGSSQEMLEEFIKRSLWEHEQKYDKVLQEKDQLSAELLIKEQILSDLKLQHLQ
jgi:hypothetical protein